MIEERTMTARLLEKLRGIDRLFLICVILPVTAAFFYFGLFASDVYVSEAKFVMRSPEKQAASALGLMLASAGFSNTGNEAMVAKSFLESRNALEAINKNNSFSKAFTRNVTWFGDRFNPTGMSGSFEDLYPYYLRHVTVLDDPLTSISTLTVRAYTAEDAHRINEELLRLTEDTVNRMNERGRRDLISYAQIEAEDAKKQARDAAVALAQYRNHKGVLDPEIQATTQLTMISKLQDELISTRAQLAQLRRFTPQNPQIPSLTTHMETLESEIRDQMKTLTGSDTSLASSVVRYQRLYVENEFADKQLTAALASLQDARNEARRKQIYVQRVVEPNLPDSAIEPRRLRGILATLALGLVVWGIASMLAAGIREHTQ